MKSKYRKILNLPPYYFPEQIASSHLTKDLMDAFGKEGYSVVLHTPTPTRGITQDTRNKYKNIKYEKLNNGSILINRFSMFKEPMNPILRAIRYILVNIIQFFKAIKEKNICLIYGGSTPPTQGLTCIFVKKILKVPFIYNLQDIFPESLVHTGLTRKGSFVWNIGRCIEKITYRNADKIIVISESFKQNLLKKNVPENKIVVIPNWVDSEKVFPVPREKNPLFSKFKINPDSFYITYCGNIGYTQNLELLVSVAKKLKNFPDIKIILFGEGAYLEEFLDTIKKEKLENIIHFPFQPYEDIASVFSLGDVGLIISKSGVSLNSVPSKTWSIMAAARPVLASFDLDSMLGEVITESKCGLIVPPNNEEALYDAVIRLYKERKNLSKFGENGRDYVKTKLSKEFCTKKYIKVIEEVT